MIQFTQQELAQMSPEVRAWAMQNGFVEGTIPRLGFMTPMRNTQNLSAQNLGMGSGSFLSGEGDPGMMRMINRSMPEAGKTGSFLSGSGEAMSQKTADMIAQKGAEEAVKSSPEGLTGPQAFFANMALEAIPTRDRNKVNTPFGDQGSVPGILKGAGKGALLGGTIGSAVPGVGTAIGATAGGIIGGLAGTQGTFDSTSPRQVIQRSYTRPRAGGLLAPKGLYG